MAPLDTSRQDQPAGLRRRDNFPNELPLNRRRSDDPQHANGEEFDGNNETPSTFGSTSSTPDKSDTKDDALKYNQIRANHVNSPNIREEQEPTSSSHDGGLPGNIFGHLFPTPFLKSTTTSSVDQSTTPTALAISTTVPVITTSTTTPSPPAPPPGTAVRASTSTSTDLPTSTASTVAALPTSLSPVAPSPTSSVSAASSDVPAVVTPSPLRTTSMGPVIVPLPTPLDTTSQPRNGLNPDADDTSTTSSISTKSTAVNSFVPYETASGTATTGQAQIGENSHQALTPTAENFLIAAGAIGAFIIVIAGIYFIMRMRNMDMFSIFRNREIRRGDSGRFGWRRKRPDSTVDHPTNSLGGDNFRYGSDAFPEDIKPAIPERYSARQFSPLIIPKVDIPQTVRTPLLAESRHQYATQDERIESLTPFEASQAPAASHQASENTIKESYTMSSTHINNTYRTDPALIPQNGSSSYDPVKKQPNRMSEQSSLSSGFGDGQIIIPGSTPPKSPAARTSQSNSGQTRDFSWVTSIFQSKQTEDRDTIYTTTSEELATRYRTVNSWVAEQTRHVERRHHGERDIPQLPQAPLPVQSVAKSRRKTNDGPEGNNRISRN